MSAMMGMRRNNMGGNVAGGGGGGGSYLPIIGPQAEQMLTPYAMRGNEAYSSNLPDKILQDMMLRQSGGYQNQLADYNANAPDYRNMPNVWAGHKAPEQRNQMATNPQEFMDRIMRGYEPSAGYQYRQKQALGAARNAAAAGGVVGTNKNQQESADLVREIMGQDQGEFLRNILGIQESGLGAQERFDTRRLEGSERHQGRQMEGLHRLFEGRQNLMTNQGNQEANLASLWAQIAANRNEAREGRGYDSAHRLTDILGQNLSNMESLRVSQERQAMRDLARQQEARERQQEAKNRRKQGMMSFLGQLGGAAAGAYFGGPAGAQVGHSVGGQMGGFF